MQMMGAAATSTPVPACSKARNSRQDTEALPARVMPIQLESASCAPSAGQRLSLRWCSAVISSVLTTKYSTALAMVASSSRPGPYRSWTLALARTDCSRLPRPNMAMLAMAGLAMRLVQRLDVRQLPVSPSAAAATMAAAGPSSSSSRKTKISPAANELLLRGMRIGTRPAIMAMAVPTTTCSWLAQGSASSCSTDPDNRKKPTSTTAHQ